MSQFKVNWIFENRVFDDNMAAFKAAVESQGCFRTSH